MSAFFLQCVFTLPIPEFLDVLLYVLHRDGPIQFAMEDQHRTFYVLNLPVARLDGNIVVGAGQKGIR